MAIIISSSFESGNLFPADSTYPIFLSHTSPLGHKSFLCGRHCNLNEPHCERGEEYLRTGKLPEHKHSEHHHFGKRMQHYHDASMNDRLIINRRDISHMMHKQYEGKASQERSLIILNESYTTLIPIPTETS